MSDKTRKRRSKRRSITPIDIEKRKEKISPEKLKQLEQNHDVKLIVESSDFNLEKSTSLSLVMKKGEILTLPLITCGRYRNERIGVYKNRSILIQQCDDNPGKKIKVKIVRTKHNIYTAIPTQNLQQ